MKIKIFLLFTLISTSIFAQEKKEELEEVVVTAQKKEENVQRIPIAVSVLNEKKLQKTRTWNTNDITALVPNMYVIAEGSMYMYYAVRGIASYSYEPVVQTYIDDVPLFSNLSLQSQLFDVNRMEILRGPQGTLYGRNAIGGVVNIVSNKPTNILKGRAEMSFGNYGQQRYNFAIASPIIKDKLFIATNATFNKRNGYVTNTNLNAKVEATNTISGSLNLKYLISDTWSVAFNNKIDRFKSYGIGIAISDVEALSNPYTILHSSDPTIIRTLQNSSIVFKHQGAKTIFTSISALNNVGVKYLGDYDVDYTPSKSYYYSYEKYGAPDKERNLYQEFRLSSADTKDSKIRWIAGTTYYKIKSNKRYESHTGPDSGDPDAPYINLTDATENHHGFAGFGQITYSPIKKLDITGGLRYDNESKNLSQFTEYIKEPTIHDINPAQKNSGHFTATSPKLSLTYKFTDQSMLYGSYAKGFRSGGINWGVTTENHKTYKPEYSDNFELGFKSTFLQNKVRFNATLFWLKYKDIQAYTFFDNNIFEGGNVNAGDAISKGAEVEFTIIPIKGLEIEESFGYTDAKYDNFLIYDSSGGVVNYKNKKAIYAPNVTNMTAIQYSFPLKKGSDALQLTIRGEYRHIGKVYYSFDNLTSSPAYSLLNASIGITAKHWEINFWGRNLNDKVFLTSVYPWGGASYGTPRMIGVTLVGKL